MNEKLNFVRNNIRYYRIRSGLSQQNVADRLGISRVRYCNYEVDPSLIKISTLTKLSDVLGCKLRDFFAENIVT